MGVVFLPIYGPLKIKTRQPPAVLLATAAMGRHHKFLADLGFSALWLPLHGNFHLASSALLLVRVA